MAFTVEDLVEILGGNHTRGSAHESSLGEVSSLRFNDLESLKTLFPDEKFSDTASVAYIPSVLCNSYPARNKRGRMFMPNVLLHSIGSVRDSMVNIDHMVSSNGTGSDREEIIGHVKAGSFQWKECADIPTEPIPAHALSALFMRHPRVKKILQEENTKKSWMTSMECEHKLSEGFLHYRGEFIPVPDADPGMLECVKRFNVAPYKGHELSLCLGGMNGMVDFHGYALTQSPADTNAAILGIVAPGYEVASVNGKRRKYFPIQFSEFDLKEKTPEAASAAVDSKFTELASIGVIGKTDPSAEDGHAHDVLSNGTIVPYEGHTHYLSSWAVSRGTNPALTGVTDTHCHYPVVACACQGQCCCNGPTVARDPYSHLHLVNINLRGKSNASAGDVPESDVSNYTEADEMKVQELLAKFDKFLEQVSTGKLKVGDVANAGGTDAATELLREFRTEIASINKSTEIADAVKAEIATQISAGTIMTKEAHEADVKRIEEEAKQKLEAEKTRLAKRQGRLDKITALGINLESMPWEGKEETVLARIDGIEYDATGDKLFDLQYDNLVLLSEKAKGIAKAEAAPAGAEAATAPKKKVPFLVGGSTEVATSGTPATGGAKKIGRHAISSR